MAGLLESFLTTFVATPVILLLGIVHCIFMLCFLVLSIPVFIYRKFVLALAKLFRPDLGDVLSGQSAVLVNDYMAQGPPRSNGVQIMIFEGQLTLEEIKRRIFKSWIIENGPFTNFLRYPVKWLGFTFWKDASHTFSIDNHLKKHSGNDATVSEEQLVEIAETMLNAKYNRNEHQSPWDLHLIENYQYPYSETKSIGQHHSVLIFKFHHCLMDGVGMMTALMDGLFEQRWIQQAAAPRPKQTCCQKLLFSLTFPVKAFFEISYIFSHTFRKDPFKVPDEMKEWHQVSVKSDPIPIHVIKDIKNAFGVSYTSVLISAMSAAVHKTVSNAPSPSKKKSMLCMSVLPPVGTFKRKVLDNRITGAIFDLPTVRYEDPIDRLRAVNRIFENTRRSVIPLVGQYYTSFVGAQPYFFNRFLTKNRMIPIGLTNFVFASKNIDVTENLKWIDSMGFAGAHDGITGMCVITLTHGQKTSFLVTAERALMSKIQAKEFIDMMKEEIGLLQNLALL